MRTGSFPGVKRPGRGADHLPPSKCRGQERVGLYLYSPYGPLWPVMGAPLPLFHHCFSLQNKFYKCPKKWCSQGYLCISCNNMCKVLRSKTTWLWVFPFYSCRQPENGSPYGRNMYQSCAIHRVSRGECASLRQNVPYVKVHRYNPKHLYPKLNGYGDNGERRVWSSCGST